MARDEKKYNKWYRSTPHGKAVCTWTQINERAENKNGKCPTYANVKVLMTREEWLEWAVPEYEKAMKKWPNERISVNRLDQHYEIGKLEIIPHRENVIQKPSNKNVHAPDGMAWCGRCKAYLDTKDFHKCKTYAKGVYCYCINCTAALYQERTYKNPPLQKNVNAPDGMAWCGRCKAYLDKECFNKCKSRYNGLSDRCRSCCKEISKNRKSY